MGSLKKFQMRLWGNKFVGNGAYIGGQKGCICRKKWVNELSGSVMYINTQLQFQPTIFSPHQLNTNKFAQTNGILDQ